MNDMRINEWVYIENSIWGRMIAASTKKYNKEHAVEVTYDFDEKDKYQWRFHQVDDFYLIENKLRGFMFSSSSDTKRNNHIVLCDPSVRTIEEAKREKSKYRWHINKNHRGFSIKNSSRGGMFASDIDIDKGDHLVETKPGSDCPNDKWTWEIIPITHTGWMGENWELLSNKTLSEICLPGSHDAGTFTKTHMSIGGSDRVTKTQIFDIYNQLLQGVRFFDLRPVIYENDFYTAHYTPVKVVGIQGAVGVKLTDAFNQIQLFLSRRENQKELIILDLCHFFNWDDEISLTDDQQKEFVSFVQEKLNTLLICREACCLADIQMNHLIDCGNIIALFPNNFKDLDPQKGTWNRSKYFKTKGSYSKTNHLNVMVADQKKKLSAYDHSEDNSLFKLCWELTLSDAQSGTPYPLSSISCLDLASRANQALFEILNSWEENGIINNINYPNIIRTDACLESTTKAVELSLKICEMTPMLCELTDENQVD